MDKEFLCLTNSFIRPFPDGYDGPKRVRVQPSMRSRGIAGMPVLETAREQRETCLQFFLTA